MDTSITKITIATIYFVSSIIWVFLLGFASIPAIFAGLVFGSYLGSVLSIFSFTIGATLLYFSDVIVDFSLICLQGTAVILDFAYRCLQGTDFLIE